MNRGDQTDEPIEQPVTGVTGPGHAGDAEGAAQEVAEGAAQEVPQEVAQEVAQLPAEGPDFAVEISADGSATVNGQPVLASDGESVDAAVLDTLHEYAREAGTGVTAAIADASGYVAYVEVAPDGSSTMLEGPPEGEVPAPPVVLEKSAAEADGYTADDGYDAGYDDPSDDWPDEPGAAGPESADEASYRLPEPPPLETESEPESGLAPGPGLESGAPNSSFAAPSLGLSAPSFGGDESSYSLPEPEEPPQNRPLLSRTPPPEPAKKTRQSDDEYEGPGLLHKPMVIGPVSLGVAALVIIPLVILGSNSGGGGSDREQAAGANSSAETSSSPESLPTPTVSVSASTGVVSPSPSASGSASPSASPTPSESARGTLPGGGTVTITARPPQATTTVTAKPAAETAATAVNRLYKQDPSGRHICYRVYVTGQGWQKPVCDGTLAGTTGQGKSIKAVQISVRGVNGSAANAFFHNPSSTNGIGVWNPNWTAVVPEGTNFTIGNASRSAPDILAFAMNVGSGQVCQVSSNFKSGWHDQTCSQPRPELVTVGSFSNDQSLEAVKLTV